MGQTWKEGHKSWNYGTILLSRQSETGLCLHSAQTADLPFEPIDVNEPDKTELLSSKSEPRFCPC